MCSFRINRPLKAAPNGAGPLRAPIGRNFGVVAGVLAGMLSMGCGFSPIPQPAPAAPLQPRGLRPAPGWVTDRMNRTVPDLYFEVNSHVLDAGEQRKLAQVTQALEALLFDCPDLIIVIEGHSDDRGLIEYNDRLAMERAEAVRRVLLDMSFPDDRLRTASFGYRAPQCRTQDDACRQKNRCVHFRAALTMGAARGEKGGDNP
jgi:outer membrane protein OmpA-like peptidoglycan-associated protein